MLASDFDFFNLNFSVLLLLLTLGGVQAVCPYRFGNFASCTYDANKLCASKGGIGAKLPHHTTWTWACSGNELGRLIAGATPEHCAQVVEDWSGCEHGPNGKHQAGSGDSAAWKGWSVAIASTAKVPNMGLPGVEAGSTRFPVNVVKGMLMFAGPRPDEKEVDGAPAH